MRGSSPKPFRISLATGKQRDEAYDVQSLVYTRDIGHIPNDGQDDGATFLVAQDSSGSVVATMRILEPILRPFDYEQVVDLDDVIGVGRRPAVVGRLCVLPQYRGVSVLNLLHLALFRFAYNFACERQITDYLLYTYDNLIPFYTWAQFRALKRFDHPDWGSVTLMHLDVVALSFAHPSTLNPLARRIVALEA